MACSGIGKENLVEVAERGGEAQRGRATSDCRNGQAIVRETGLGRRLVAVLQPRDQPERQAFVAADMMRAKGKREQRTGRAAPQRADEMPEIGHGAPAAIAAERLFIERPGQFPGIDRARIENPPSSGDSLRGTRISGLRSK